MSVATNLLAVRVAFIVPALVVSALCSAQQPARTYRLGLMMAGPPEASRNPIEAFRQGLRELGYAEGKNLEIDIRWHAADRPDSLPGLAEELVRARPDVLLAPTTPQILALKQATKTVPIVMIAPSDPVGSGLVDSLAHPGGNVTGFAWMSRDIMGKRLQLLKEILPKISRIGDLWNPANPSTQRDFSEIEAAARAMGLSVQSAQVREPNEFANAFQSLMQAHAEGLVVQADYLTWVHRKQIAALAAQHRLPSMFSIREYVDDGGLVSYGASIADLFRRSAGYVDKILKGARPADLPVEQPTKFELIINLKTAKAIGIVVPEAVLLRADEVIR
jgi:putative ABC transport system substrate-binding protein